MNKDTSKIGVVTERDRNLFDYLFENKVATVEDIRHDIFNNASKALVYKRLGKLERSELIQRSAYSLEDKLFHVYSVTEKSYERFIVIIKEDIRRRQLKSDTIEHDLALVDIKRRLKKLVRIKNYFSENQLQSNKIYYNPN